MADKISCLHELVRTHKSLSTRRKLPSVRIPWTDRIALPEMASYKSRYSLTKWTDDQMTYTHNTPTSQSPLRPITRTVTTSQVHPLGPTKLQKRRSTRNELYATGTVGGYGIPIPKAPAALGPRNGSAASTVPLARPNPHSTVSKAASQSSSRLPRLEVPPASTRTPSLVSGEPASIVDSPRSNLLKRKQTSIGLDNGRRGYQIQTDPMPLQPERHLVSGIPGGYKDPFSETVLGITLPPTSTILDRPEADVEFSELASHRNELTSTDVLLPPAPHYAASTTPSTRYSESPGPFSVSSTPTSMSSYSPSVTMSTKPTAKTRQVSPLQGRPRTTRYLTPEERVLPSNRGASVLSASTSTVPVDGSRTIDKLKEGLLAWLVHR